MESLEVFCKLVSIMREYDNNLNCITDEPGEYYLNTNHIMKNKKALNFGGVKINKNYVSYHLMPVYVEPTLLNKISTDLKKRMQGKSCFNFITVDEDLFIELRKLTKKGYQFYKSEGYL